MKKIFIALSVLVALFIASPSSALVGSPDNVPGYDVQMPFFLVGMDGVGVDTLMVIQEIGGSTYAGPNGVVRVVGSGATKGSVHTVIFDRYSIDRGSWTWTYTPNDVYPISIRQAIVDTVGVNELAYLEIDLDGDGINDHYAGYIYNENTIMDVDPVTALRISWPLNNLIGKQYLVDLPNGLASGANMVSREYCGRTRTNPADPFNQPFLPGFLDWSSTFYQRSQYMTTGSVGRRITDDNLEVFNSEALAISAIREHENSLSPNFLSINGGPFGIGFGAQPLLGNATVATGFTLAPRFFLRSDTANSYFFLWTDMNHGALAGVPAPTWQWRHTVNIYDEDEYVINMNLNIPYELNFVNFANELPGGAAWAPPIGGWLDLNTLDANTAVGQTASQYLGSSYQTDEGPAANLNWAALFEVHRDVGTL